MGESAETPSTLADLLQQQHEQVLDRFVEALYQTSIPPSVDRERALDSASKLLEELRSSLRASGEAYMHQAELSSSGTEHGAQRFEVGVDLPTMVREYRGLQSVIFDLIEESPETPVSTRELRVLAWFIVSASARAAESYTRERDAEVQRQTTRHVAFLAHELRNPLGSIALGLAISKENGDVKPSPTVLAIERGIGRMQTLIDSALIEMRLRDSGELAREWLEVRALATEIVEESRAELEAKAQQVEIQAGEADLMLSGDRRLLRSAVSNLVRNAVKFSPRGSTIYLRARPSAGRVIIEVEDACGGLPEGAVQKMFDPFVQTGKDRSGFGLGLAIAHQAARAHHGTIRVNDLPGKGCTFAIDLPVSDPSKDEPDGGAPPPVAASDERS